MSDALCARRGQFLHRVSNAPIDYIPKMPGASSSSSPRLAGTVAGCALSALLLVVRPAASALLAASDGRAWRYWSAVLVLVIVGWALGAAVMEGRRSRSIVGIPAAAMFLVYAPLVANGLRTPRWYPHWLEWTHFAIDLPVLIGLLLGATIWIWRRTDQETG